jgi:hypothetical protein
MESKSQSKIKKFLTQAKEFRSEKRRKEFYRKHSQGVRIANSIMIALIGVAAIHFIEQGIKSKGKKFFEPAELIQVGNIESFSILTLASLYILESDERKKRKHYEAWQVIDNAYETSFARRTALEDLYEDGIRNFKDIDLPGADLKEINLSDANLRKSNLSGADLVFINLIRADLADSKLIDTELMFARFSGARMLRTDFSKSRLNCAYFQNAVLGRAKFSNAQICGADFTDASATNTDFSGAFLGQTKFYGADLHGSDFTMADMREIEWDEITNLKDTKGLDFAINVPMGFKEIWEKQNSPEAKDD